MAGWGSYYARSMDEELGTEYSPDLLTKKPILLSPYLLSVVAKAECEYSRADERVSLGANKEAVREFLINLESLAAAAIDGDSINLVDLLTANIVPETPEKGRTGGAPVPRARLYKQLIKKHSDPKAAKAVHFDRDFVFALHAELCGASPDDRRHWAYRGAQAARPDQVHPRLPQKRTVPPNRIERYMDDLCGFCNKEYYSPQVQACLPHFQIEYVKPFKSHGEALGRHVSYLVYARRGLCRTAIVPIALTSIARINAPVDPYKVDHRSPSQQPLALWVLHGAKSLEVTASFVRDIDGRLSAIEEKWRGKVRSVRNGDHCDLLLHDLLANPVINSTYAIRLSGKTPPAIGDAFAKLQEAGVIRPLNEKRRYRLFCADDVVACYYQVLDAVIPPSWVPGKALFYD